MLSPPPPYETELLLSLELEVSRRFCSSLCPLCILWVLLTVVVFVCLVESGYSLGSSLSSIIAVS